MVYYRYIEKGCRYYTTAFFIENIVGPKNITNDLALLEEASDMLTVAAISAWVQEGISNA